jgi:hypothetical protein
MVLSDAHGSVTEPLRMTLGYLPLRGAACELFVTKVEVPSASAPATTSAGSAGVERTVADSVYVHPVDPVVAVSVRPDRRWELRPRCGARRQRAPRYDRGSQRRWRSLDCGLLQVYFEADLPCVHCRDHQVGMAAVPWARHGTGHTIAFDETVAWFAVSASKTLIAMPCTSPSVGIFGSCRMASLPRERPHPDRPRS